MENKDLLLMIEAIANEKNIDVEDVFLVLEEALATATKRRQKINVHVNVDRRTGEFSTNQQFLVVADDADAIGADEEPFDENLHIRQADAPEHNVDDIIEQAIPSVPFGRIVAQNVKQLITQKVREVERNRVIDSYRDKVGQIIITTVKRIDRGNIYVDLGGVDGIIAKNDAIANETLKRDDRIRAYLKEIVEMPNRGPQIFLSRTSKGFLMELFKMEVPEVSSELIELKNAARDPGLRSKLAVRARDKRIDPVGSCIGMRGARVQAVSNELNGERIDIILWDENPAQFVINAIAPAEVSSIVIDEERQVMDLIVDVEQLAQAIGRNGQNIRLASQLTGWRLNVMSKEEAEKQSNKETQELSQKLADDLGVDEHIASALVNAELTNLDVIDSTSDEELADIEDFDEKTIAELRDKIQDAILAKALSDDQSVDVLLNIEGVDEDLANALIQNNIVSQENLADLSVEELLDIYHLDAQKASDIIMAARAPWLEQG